MRSQERREGRMAKDREPSPPPMEYSCLGAIGTLDNMKSGLRDWLEVRDQGPAWLGSGGPLPGAQELPSRLGSGGREGQSSVLSAFQALARCEGSPVTAPSPPGACLGMAQ